MTAPHCSCSHARTDHGTDRKGRVTCYGAITCACREWRSPEIEAAQARHPAGKAIPTTGDTA